MKHSRAPLTRTTRALHLLGAQIRIARQQHGWTEAGFAERVGVSDKTIRNLERGSATVAIGTVFDAATIAGVALFEEEDTRLTRELAAARRQLTLLPQRTRRKGQVVDDDF